MSDLQTREEALDSTQSFIVQAPAGSGKTTLLTSRFVSLLETVDQPEEILAMTFTRKATAEMRERILEVLDPNSDTVLYQESARLAVERVRKRSLELGWNLHNQPSRLQIMTFDALATALIRCMPWSSRFGSVPGVAEIATHLYSEAAINTIESSDSAELELRQAIQLLHRQLDNKSDKLKELIVSLLAKRDQWLKILVNSTPSGTPSEEDRVNMEKVWSKFVNLKLDELVPLFPALTRKTLCLNEIDNSNPDAIVQWQVVKGILMTTNGTWRRAGFPQCPDWYPDLDTPVMKKLATECSSHSLLAGKLALVDRLPTSTYVDGQWNVLQATNTVLLHAVAQLKLEFRKRGEVDFIEIAQRAVEALGTPSNPTDLSMVLDYRYRHILVDEFQDSSINQLKLLETLTGGWVDGDGRTIFLVGDPMQSIYRFREAEVGIYLSVVESGLGNIRPKPLQLNQNFRSSANLVNWFNDVFEPSFPQESDVLGSRVEYSKCYSDKQNEINFPVHVCLQNTHTEDGTKVAGDLSKLAEAHKVVSDICAYLDQNVGSVKKAAILVRNRSHIAHLIPLLDKHNIHYYATDMFSLSKRPVVQDLLSITRALLNLADRGSWLSILRAPWCGLTLDDLLMIAEEEKSNIWAQLKRPEVFNRLSPDGQQRVARFREVLMKSLSVRGRLGIRQWVEDTWVMLGGPACVSSYDEENARLYLNFMENYAKGSEIDDLEQFVDKLEGLFATPQCSPDDAQLQVMTIHGAKGLEFDAVFIPSTHGGPGRSPDPLINWSEVLLQNDSSGMLIAPIHDTGQKEKDDKYDFIKKWNTEKDRMELTRLVYVGCTRAKSELHLYGCCASEKNNPQVPKQTILGSLLRNIWPGIVESDYQFVDFSPAVFGMDEILEDNPEGSVSPVISRLSSEWNLPDTPPPLNLPDRELEAPDHKSIDFEWAGSVAVWVGTIVHNWLNRIVQSGSENWNLERLKQERPQWQNALIAMGINSDSDEFDEAIEKIESALVNVFEDSTGTWLLDSQHQDGEAEYRLTGYVDGRFKNVILDRTFVDSDGTRWIVDYKTGTTGGDVEDFLDNEVKRYRDQLLSYKQIMSGLDSRPIRMGLYFPVFPAWREVVD